MSDSMNSTYDDMAQALKGFGLDLSPSSKCLVNVTAFLRIPDGSHIAVPSDQSLLGPWHHGIKIGPDTVMHMYGHSKEDAHIQECTAEEFTAATRMVAVVQYGDDTDESRAASVNAAYFLKENLRQFDLYSIVGFNCEHFAVLCRSGLTRYTSSITLVTHLLCLKAEQPSFRLQKLRKQTFQLQDVFRTSRKGSDAVGAGRGRREEGCREVNSGVC